MYSKLEHTYIQRSYKHVRVYSYIMTPIWGGGGKPKMEMTVGQRGLARDSEGVEKKSPALILMLLSIEVVTHRAPV